jgi:hypothetical protein
MKTNRSSYILAAEILTIILFHAVKIRQSEKRPAEMVFSESGKSTVVHQPQMEKKTGSVFMMADLVK